MTDNEKKILVKKMTYVINC